MIAPSNESGTNGRHALEGALDAIPVGVVLFDPSGRPIVTSRAARELLGDISSRSLERWPESGIFVDATGSHIISADFAPLQTLRDGRSRREVEVGIESVDGTVTPVMMCSRGVLDPDGEVVQVALSLTPLVEQTRRRTQERMSERFETIGALTASVAGPLNDALTAIAGYCELARRNLSDGDPVQGVLSEIRQAGQRATVLAGRLLAHGREEVAVPQVLDLDRWLALRVTALDALLGDGIRLEPNPGSEGHLVEVDSRLLEQVLADVLANAREAMPDGGCVRISTRLSTGDLGLLGEGEAAESTVVMSVTDSGGGIADAVLRRIFEPFFSTRPGALGLGLPTVERLMRLQGGQVRVENHRGTGLSIHLHMKPAPVDAEEPQAWQQPAATLRKGPKVLVVEDDEFVRELEVEVLQRERYQVVEARNPAEALRMVESDEVGPALLISDLAMPGETGGSMAEKLQGRYPDMQVLFVSGASDPTALAGSFVEGRTAFLAKPFSPEALVARVAELLKDLLTVEETPPPVELLEPAAAEPAAEEEPGTLDEEPVQAEGLGRLDEPSAAVSDPVRLVKSDPLAELGRVEAQARPVQSAPPVQPIRPAIRPAHPINRPEPPRGPVNLRPSV